MVRNCKKKSWMGIGMGSVFCILLAVSALFLGASCDSGSREEYPTAGITLELPGGVKLGLARIKSGTVNMSVHGSDSSFEARLGVVSDFHLGRVEVTQAQWKAVMGNNPSKVKGDDLPVTCVSWHDAKKFCDKLNRLYAGKLPQGYRFDLPRKTQWMFAFCGGTKSRGEKFCGSDDLDEVAWHGENSDQKPHSVAKKKPNELGLYDMEGNVGEWCLDPFDVLLKGGKLVMGSSFEVSKIFFENSHGPGYCLVGHPDANKPESRCDGVGFRVALVPVEGR